MHTVEVPLRVTADSIFFMMTTIWWVKTILTLAD